LIRNLSGESEAIYFNGLRVIVKGSRDFQEVQEGRLLLPLPSLAVFNPMLTLSPEGAVEFAQGDDVFTIHYNYDVVKYVVDDERFEGRFADELSVKWSDIFMAISPYMLDGISNASIKQRLEEFIRERVHPSITSQFERNVDAVHFEITDSDIQTIKIQLRALGLIIQSQREEVDWALTPQGDRQMTSLRTIKKTFLQS
jgi:predicted DNA binding CopG/RHH family protein